MKAKKRIKTKARYSKKIVTLVIILNSVFAFLALYVFLQTSSEPTALIAAWFGFTTGELWIMKDIKKTEIKEGGNRNENRSEEETY